MLKGTYENYLLVEQKNLAMTYLIRGIEKELLDGNVVVNIIDNKDNKDNTIVSISNGKEIKQTPIPINNMVLTTTVEDLPDKDGVSYAKSKVKLVTASIEFYMKKNDPSSKRVLELKTFKIEGD